MRTAVVSTGVTCMVLCILGLGSLHAQTKPPVDEATPVQKYVYLVNRDGEAAQTGFRVHGTRGLVTALHGVIGARSITARNKKGELLAKSLTVTKVDIKRDLALLSSAELDKLEANGLPVAIGIDLKALSGTRVDIVGYPFGLNLRELWLTSDVSKDGVRELRTLIPPDIQKVLNIRQSPAPSLTVLHIEGKIYPGHSGGPVMDAEHRVVAVANGGLHSGTASISWAIPLSEVEWESVEGNQTLAKLKAMRVSDLFIFDKLRGEDADRAMLKAVAELARTEMDAARMQAHTSKAAFATVQWVSKEGQDLAEEAARTIEAATNTSRAAAEEMVRNRYEAATDKFEDARTKFDTAGKSYSKAATLIEPERFTSLHAFVKTADENKECGGWRVRVLQGGKPIFVNDWGWDDNWDNGSERPLPDQRTYPLGVLVDGTRLEVSSSIEEKDGAVNAHKPGGRQVRIDWGIDTMTITLKTNRGRALTFERKGFTHKSRGNGRAQKTLDIPQTK